MVSFLELLAIPRSIVRLFLFVFWVPPGPIRYPLTIPAPPRNILELPPAYRPALLLDAPIVQASTNSTYEVPYANWTTFLYADAICNPKEFRSPIDTMAENVFWAFLVMLTSALFALSSFILFVHHVVLPKIKRVTKAVDFFHDQTKAEIDAALYQDVVAYSVGDIVIDEAQFEYAPELALDTANKAPTMEWTEGAELPIDDADTSISTVRPNESMGHATEETELNVDDAATPVRSRRSASPSPLVIEIEQAKMSSDATGDVPVSECSEAEVEALLAQDDNELSSSEFSTSSPRLTIDIMDSMASPTTTSVGSLSECSDAELEELDLASVEPPMLSWQSTTPSEETPVSAVYMGDPAAAPTPTCEPNVESVADNVDTHASSNSTEENSSIESEDMQDNAVEAVPTGTETAAADDDEENELANSTLVEEESTVAADTVLSAEHGAASVDSPVDSHEEAATLFPSAASNIGEAQSPLPETNEPLAITDNDSEPLETTTESDVIENHGDKGREENGDVSPSDVSSESTSGSTSFDMVGDGESESLDDNYGAFDASSHPLDAEPEDNSVLASPDDSEVTLVGDDVSGTSGDDTLYSELDTPLETTLEEAAATVIPGTVAVPNEVSSPSDVAIDERDESSLLPAPSTATAVNTVEDIEAGNNGNIDAPLTIPVTEPAVVSPADVLTDEVTPPTSPSLVSVQASITDPVECAEDASEIALGPQSSPLASEKDAEELASIVSSTSTPDVSPVALVAEPMLETTIDPGLPEASPAAIDTVEVSSAFPGADLEVGSPQASAALSTPLDEELIGSESTDDGDIRESGASTEPSLPVIDTPSETMVASVLPSVDIPESLELFTESAAIPVPPDSSATDSADALDDIHPLNDASLVSPGSTEDKNALLADNTTSTTTGVLKPEGQMTATVIASDVLPVAPTEEITEPTAVSAAVPINYVDGSVEDILESSELPLDDSTHEDEPVHTHDETAFLPDLSEPSDSPLPVSPVSPSMECTLLSAEVAIEEQQASLENPHDSEIVEETPAGTTDDIEDVEDTKDLVSEKAIERPGEIVTEAILELKTAAATPLPADDGFELTTGADSPVAVAIEEPSISVDESTTVTIPSIPEAPSSPTQEGSSLSEIQEVSPTSKAAEELVATEPLADIQDAIATPLPADDIDDFADDLDSPLGASVLSESLLSSAFLTDAEQSQTLEATANPFADPVQGITDKQILDGDDDTSGDLFVEYEEQATVPVAPITPQDNTHGMADSWIVLPPEEQDAETALAQHVPAPLLTAIPEDSSLEAAEAERSDDTDATEPAVNESAPSPLITHTIVEQEAKDSSVDENGSQLNDSQSPVVEAGAP
ncbi:hypothetical protein EIP86_008028 [Pleurotus ostreatoroseus]|nr:hypothetical protein EIP86_008028 [Pleurotus ostreatoroseus]